MALTPFSLTLMAKTSLIKVKPMSLTKKRNVRQGKIVELLRLDGAIKVDALAAAFKVSDQTILRHLETLRKEERIVRIGSDTSGRWNVIENRDNKA
jgi:predicted ArsR family transcriptional regulator